jgi:N-acetyl-anhydromuramyl-L-alanine amidase AmpD
VPIPIRFVRGPHAARSRRAPASFSPRDVATVQQALDVAGYPCPVSGYWDDASCSACGAFQEARGLPCSGHIDDVTLDALGVELP